MTTSLASSIIFFNHGCPLLPHLLPLPQILPLHWPQRTLHSSQTHHNLPSPPQPLREVETTLPIPLPPPARRPQTPRPPLPFLCPPSLPPHLQTLPRIHCRVATDYAATLFDANHCDCTLDAVEQDVRRLLRMVAAGVAVEDGAVMAAVEGGGFYKLVVVLVRLLVRKGKVGMVGEVMAEVGGICNELSRMWLVVVSSEGRMGEAELWGIARKVGRVSASSSPMPASATAPSSSSASSPIPVPIPRAQRLHLACVILRRPTRSICLNPTVTHTPSGRDRPAHQVGRQRVYKISTRSYSVR